jgi:hypothetical protein
MRRGSAREAWDIALQLAALRERAVRGVAKALPASASHWECSRKLKGQSQFRGIPAQSK